MGLFDFLKKRTGKAEDSYKPADGNKHGEYEEKKPLPPNLKFHYFTTDKAADYRFWDDAVSVAEGRRRDKNISYEFSGWRITEVILVTSEPDFEYPDNREMDSNVIICVYSNEGESRLRFLLYREFPSPWDGGPSYQGGEITPEEFKTYMAKIGNHKYDGLVD